MDLAHKLDKYEHKRQNASSMRDRVIYSKKIEHYQKKYKEQFGGNYGVGQSQRRHTRAQKGGEISAELQQNVDTATTALQTLNQDVFNTDQNELTTAINRLSLSLIHI